MIEPGTQEVIDAELFEQAKNVIERQVMQAKQVAGTGDFDASCDFSLMARGAMAMWLQCTSPEGYEKYEPQLRKIIEP